MSIRHRIQAATEVLRSQLRRSTAGHSLPSLSGGREVLREQVARLRQGGLRGFLQPGVRLLDRLRYPAKFGLIALVSSVAIGFFVVSLLFAVYSELSTARAELAGLKVWEPAARLTTGVHALAGETASAGAGDEAAKGRLGSARSEVSQALKALDAAIAASDLELTPQAQAMAKEWRQLDPKIEQLSTKDLAPAFAPLSGLLLDFMRDLGESSQLISDASPESAYLGDLLVRRIPQLADSIVSVQTLGAKLLVEREINAEWRQIGTHYANLQRGTQGLAEVMRRDAAANPSRKAQLDSTREQLTTALAGFAEITDRELVKGGFTLPVPEFSQAAAQAREALLNQAGKSLLPPLRSALEARIERLQARFWSTGIAVGVILALLTYASLAMFVAILGTVEELSDGAQRIGSGDLTARVQPSSHDELRAVAEQFNGMAENFAGVIGGLKRSVAELSDSARALRDSAERVTHGSAQQSEAASAMAAAIEEMAVGVDEISRHAGSAEACSQQTGTLADDGSKVVRDTVTEMERIADAVNESAEVIRELGKNTARISKIANSIKEIADQTNLLALNASIEAARAGDEGRGFAVVADEVRKLAERTTQATAQIGGMVGAIQGGTNRAVAAMQSGVNRVRDGVALTSQAGDAMHLIGTEAGRVVQAVSEISLALREQTSASNEIAQSVERIAQMAEQNSNVVGETARTAAQLDELARKLNTEIGRFRV